MARVREHPVLIGQSTESTKPIKPAFQGAITVSAVMKIFAIAWIILGIYSVSKTHQSLVDNGASSGTISNAVLIEIAITALGAASFGFFACVLDLLMAIESNTSTDGARRRTL
ncbi:hypothetical protein [Acidithrix ferrooxidans]|nr:hypothetical protein [Acidithrix ferrooxidans]